METVGSKRDLYDIMPVLDVCDGMIISRRGDVTIGWEVTMPVVYAAMEDGYDDIVNTFFAAARGLPDWTMIHRQDVFTYDSYVGEFTGRYLSDCFNEHFNGRRFLRHKQYLYLTMTTKASAMKANAQTAAFGIRFNAPVPKDNDLYAFEMKADEFIKVLTGCDYIKARRLTQEELVGTGMENGLIDKYLTLYQDSPLRSDFVMQPEKVRVFDKELLGFKISESEDIPGEIPDIAKTNESGSAYELFLSYGSALGVRLDCEHVVNQYILMPSQQSVLQELDRKKKKMTSMMNSPENRINAEQIEEFIDDVHRDGKTCCYWHLNVLAWCKEEEELDVKGKISSALSSMGVMATQSLVDVPSLFLAGLPGGSCEIGKDNLMTAELLGMLCMGLNETFDDGIEDGLLQVCDRMRNVPIRLDLQKLARSKSWIDNYNVFLLGPSGSGKSFFTNYFLQQCYDAGEHIFVIDVGDSYEGLCQIINETSGGKDGMYLTWDPERPFSFNPFIGLSNWLDSNGHVRQDEPGVSFLMSFLTTAWKPKDGWTSEAMTILEEFAGDFVRWTQKTIPKGVLPIFDDFYRFLILEISPRIKPEMNERGEIVRLPRNPYVIGDVAITPEKFDISGFLLSLHPYCLKGSYSFLLNDRHPKDLFASRFTVFEVLKLSDSNPLFYSLCVLCIMNAFDQKMRHAGGFKRMVVDEAWKAIANETMAPYLKGLWKTARKYQTAAMVITQELDDIISSDVIKEAILMNSDIKILLNQAKNANRFDQLSTLLGLSEHQKNLILSMGHDHNPDYFYTDVYIGMNNRYGVYAIEASRQQALAFESDKVKKGPLLERAKELGSIRAAINEKVNKERGRV